MSPPQLATRIRKARAQSVCALCDRIVFTGNTIGRVPGRGWAHVSCIVAANRETRTEGERS
jgi:hypothetical protein